MFQILPCVIANISWKFYEHPLINFTVVLLTNTPGASRWETVKQSRQVWNSLADYFLCRARHFIKISWKSVHPFFHNITNEHGSRKYKNRRRIQGVNRNIPKMFQIAPCVKSVHLWKFHENPVNRFSAMLLIGMDYSEKVGKKVLNGLNGISWKCSQLFLVSSPTYPENFMIIRSAVFSVMLLTNRQTNPGNGQRWKHHLRHGGGN